MDNIGLTGLPGGAGAQPPRVPPLETIAVIGAGAWGTALAAVAARAGRRAVLWTRRAALAEEINHRRRNSAYLGETQLPEGVRATPDLADALKGADAALLVTPSETTRALARAIAPLTPPSMPLVLCAKGVEASSGLLLSAVVCEERGPSAVAALSGPTFATEVARDLPAAVTIASAFPAQTEGRPEAAVAARVAVALSNATFRAYVSDDLVGVEVGGAMKNVIAIACGVAQGAGFQANMRAALITLGLEEMKRVAEALGGRRETVTGLSGLGDLALTCSSEQSRNFRFGLQLGAGVSAAETFGGAPVVVEGRANAISVTDLARKHGLSLPICEAVRAMVHEGADRIDALSALWARPLEAEPRGLSVTLPHPAEAEVQARMRTLMAGG
ncbi:MAG: NAD(P)H-dependent glycerol-3-phosphate dehydrogenase [Pseudomonadota bacterium]